MLTSNPLQAIVLWRSWSAIDQQYVDRAGSEQGVPAPTTIGGVALALGGLLRGRSLLKHRQKHKTVV